MILWVFTNLKFRFENLDEFFKEINRLSISLLRLICWYYFLFFFNKFFRSTKINCHLVHFFKFSLYRHIYDYCYSVHTHPLFYLYNLLNCYYVHSKTLISVLCFWLHKEKWNGSIFMWLSFESSISCFGLLLSWNWSSNYLISVVFLQRWFIELPCSRVRWGLLHGDAANFSCHEAGQQSFPAPSFTG